MFVNQNIEISIERLLIEVNTTKYINNTNAIDADTIVALKLESLIIIS